MTASLSHIQVLFLDTLRAALRGTLVSWKEPLTDGDWQALLRLAGEQQVLPMVFEAVAASPAAKCSDCDALVRAKASTLREGVLQTMKTRKLYSLLQYLSKLGIDPIIVKGIICRNLYPKPDLRLSNDEDLLISPEMEEAACEALCNFGMTEDSDPEPGAVDRAFQENGGTLYIELHTALIPPDFASKSGMDRLFEGALGRAITVDSDGHSLRTLSETDHFLFLIAHAFKHFLHHGFGLRQVCDILLFAEHFGPVIHWDDILEQCRSVRMETFLAALLGIGEKHLGFQAEKACLPPALRESAVDEIPILVDLLGGGIYGKSTMSRWHSISYINAALDSQNGEHQQFGLLRSLFPGFGYMSRNYPFLQKAPFLLPLAWCIRIVKYGLEMLKSWKAGRDNNAYASIKIGRNRVALLRLYDIID